MRILLAAVLAAALPALADEPPVPQMFRGIGGEKGQWRMEILEMQGRGGALANGMSMTICTDNLFREARERSQRRGSPECKHRLLKDTPAEMLMETECPERTSRILMKRENAKRLLMEGEVRDRRGTSTMKMRYTHEGACQGGGAGPGGVPAMRFDKDGEACRQMRGQLAQMDPDKACANSGAQRAACEARMRAAAEQMAAMCR